MIGEVIKFASRSVIGQRNVTFDTVGKGQDWGHGTPDFDAQSGRGNKKRDFQSTVAGPHSCASVALRRRLGIAYWLDTRSGQIHEYVYKPHFTVQR